MPLTLGQLSEVARARLRGDPERVIELLTDEMKAHEHVLTEPEPESC